MRVWNNHQKPEQVVCEKRVGLVLELDPAAQTRFWSIIEVRNLL